MTNKLSINYLILIIAFLFFGCEHARERSGNNVSTSSLSLHVGDKNYFFIDTKKSMVTWKGSSLNGLNTQTGYIYLSKGELRIVNGLLIGGVIEVDMNTIEDKKHQRNNKLVNHLKDPDFFEVDKFPFSTIKITRVASINHEHKNVTGNLTIKGITHPVTFPIQMESKDGIVKAMGKLVIDRSLWNVRYKSAKFYANLANQTMSDSIELHINIVTKK